MEAYLPLVLSFIVWSERAIANCKISSNLCFWNKLLFLEEGCCLNNNLFGIIVICCFKWKCPGLTNQWQYGSIIRLCFIADLNFVLHQNFPFFICWMCSLNVLLEIKIDSRSKIQIVLSITISSQEEICMRTLHLVIYSKIEDGINSSLSPLPTVPHLD